MSQELDNLAVQVANTDTVIASAVTLIQGFNAQLAAAGVDPHKLEALRVDLAAKTALLATAVAANTAQAPADPAPSAPAPVVSVPSDPAPVVDASAPAPAAAS